MENIFVIFNEDFWAGRAGISYLILIPLILIALLFNSYAIYMSFLGSFGWKRPEKNIEAMRKRKFFAVVAAHNEAAVIEDLLNSLIHQEYSRDLYDVYFVADNCNDQTAALIREYGFYVYERSDTKKKGKTWAIKDLLAHIENRMEIEWWDEYEGMAMFDADNVVHPRFFTEMNNHFEMYPDVKAVQGYADTKNVDDNALTKIYAVAYWSASRFWQLPRFRRELSAGLAGTGFVIETKTLKRIGWNPKSMVEDLELTTELVLEGERVHWNEWAIIYDEKPLSVRVSYRQRERWMRGHWWCFVTYGPQVFKALLKHRKLRYFDMLLYLASPAQMIGNFLYVVAGYTWGATVLAYYFVNNGAFSPWHLIFLFWPTLVVIQTVAFLICAPTLHNNTHQNLSMRHSLTFKYVPIILVAWFYVLMWMPIIVQSLIGIKDQNSWVRTPHTRKVTS